MLKMSLAASALLLFSHAAQSADLEKEALESFVEFAQEKYQLSPEYVRAAIADAKQNEKVLAAIARPWEAKPWHQYRPIFIKQTRIDDGAAFYAEYQETLIKAQNETGVPAEIIVAILGVETNFGGNKGSYPVLDSLYSLGFHYPPRAKFFRTELAEFLKLSEEQGFDYKEIKGSYAGAMGWSQFISSSYRHYAIDYDGDGVVDLLNNPIDAIGSVANYFKKHGWKKGQPVTFQADVNGNLDSWITKKLKPKRTWQELQKAGVTMSPEDIKQLNDSDKVTLVQLEQAEGHDYWVGLNNFYVITRYNHSPLYAMAVYQLSQEIGKKVM